MNSHAARTATVTAMLLATVAATAHAQLGGLVKKGKNAATGKATDAAAAQVPPTKVDVLPCAITYEQLSALEKGLEAELAAAPSAKKEAEQLQKQAEAEQQAYDEADKAYRKKSESWNSCRDKVINDPAANKQAEEIAKKSEAAGNKAAAGVNQSELEAMGMKAKAAAEKVQNGTATAADRQVLADFQAYMAKISQSSNAVIAASNEQTALNAEQQARLVKCGEEPKPPTKPYSLGWSPERVLLEKGAKAAGMDPETYKVVRDCAIKSANLRLSEKNMSKDKADQMNSKLEQVQQTLTSMRSANVPI